MFNSLRSFIKKKTKSDLNRQPLVTVIIATHNRPESLAMTIESVFAQTFTDWQIIIVGDKCTDDTEKVIEAFCSQKITFINLPKRFGEQAGPNSIGMKLAKTEFLAFLNHDDLWLPTHLASAISDLDSTKCDMYWSRAAFFKNRGPREDSPLFVELSPKKRCLSEVYDAPFYYSEPMSTWVLRKALVGKLGGMRLSSETAIPPIQDFVIRAFEKGGRLFSSDEVTVLKDNISQVVLPSESKRNQYDLESTYKKELLSLIKNQDVAFLHSKIENDLWLARQLKLNRQFHKPVKQGISDKSRIFNDAGIDLLRIKSRASEVNFMGLLGKALQFRTNERLNEQPDIESMLSYCKEKLSDQCVK